MNVHFLCALFKLILVQDGFERAEDFRAGPEIDDLRVKYICFAVVRCQCELLAVTGEHIPDRIHIWRVTIVDPVRVKMRFPNGLFDWFVWPLRLHDKEPEAAPPDRIVRDVTDALSR